mgnify:CR=1 FL=1
MTAQLKILVKVIQNRVQTGEKRDDVLDCYFLTDDERKNIVTVLEDNS